MTPTQRVIIVEGFLDRAFVAGALKQLGCTSLGGSGKPAPIDPWGAPVKGGTFAFSTASGAFVRLQPVGGGGLDKRVKTEAINARTKPVQHLLVIPDADFDASVDPRAKLQSKRDNLAGLCSGEALPSEEFAFGAPGIDRGDVGVWACADDLAALPRKQTLERLVCAAVAAVHPDWTAHAARFLTERPTPPALTGRELAMTHMAGWFSDRFSEGFFEAVWESPEIAAQLEQRLEPHGTWSALQRIAA